VALEQRRLDVVAAGQVTAELGTAAADQHLRALLLAELQVRQDLVHLHRRGLRAHHGVGVQRVPCLIAATRLSARSMKRS
jgi:hypothetical protein